MVVEHPTDVMPWERIVVPRDVDGSAGTYRAPRAACALKAHNDYEAVQSWLSLHESGATQRAYRKEAERLILQLNDRAGQITSSSFSSWATPACSVNSSS